MAKAVKLADIAERLSVSTVTVSKALSGQKGVSEEMRRKIQELAEELGYQQPSAKRKEQDMKSCNIGVLIAERYLDQYDFYWQMYRQTAACAVSENSFTLMEAVSEEMEQQLRQPGLAEEQKVDGMIIIGRLSERYLEFLNQNTGVPLIYLDFYNIEQAADCVISDSYYGAYRLTNYLFEMGHKKIAYVGTLFTTDSITDRYFGYVKAVLEHGEKVRKDWILKDRDPDSGLIDENLLLQLPENMPTAFLCSCDLTAGILIRKLQRAGYRVPEDISVAGYDNYMFPGLCDIGVTTYEVDRKEMAERAVQLMIKKIAGKNYRRGISVVEGYLVCKESVRYIQNDRKERG